MQTNILKELDNILKNFPQYWDGPILIRGKVVEDLRRYDKKLLKAVFESKVLCENYTKDINGLLIVLIEELIDIIKYKEYWADSYTKFSNKIGLTSGGSFIKDSPEVLLDFPFKDCVLEGGMTKEDAPKNEVFFNYTIARDEIDNMLSPKILTNIVKYSDCGQQCSTNLEPTDNLILKGNNLVALHILQKKYKGMVKLIYIDPPYNTGSDSFGYNDKYKHSSWLVFMKNRLEIAKELLSEDGVIFVSIDRNEFAELKLLLDEIFESNYLGTIVNVSTPNGRDYGSFAQTHDYIHVYAKNQDEVKTYALEGNEDKFKMEDDIGKYYLHPLFNSNSAFHIDNRPNLYYPFYLSNEPDSLGYHKLSLIKTTEYEIEVFPPKSQKDGTQFVWRWGKEKSGKLSSTELVGQMKTDGSYRVAQKMRPKNQIPRTVWQETKFSNRRGTEEVEKIFGEKRFNYPKPESLLKEILEIGSEEGDIVLDFHMGSATTQAVALKMGRQFIGIEQMDYINDVSVERLLRVIAGEQGGISKEVGWKGGGSFVYAELMELNQQFIQSINELDSIDKATQLYDQILKRGEVKFQINLELVDIKDLSLSDFKKFLLDLLDLNQLYVSYSEIDDEFYNVQDSVKQFNSLFYNEVQTK